MNDRFRSNGQVIVPRERWRVKTCEWVRREYRFDRHWQPVVVRELPLQCSNDNTHVVAIGERYLQRGAKRLCTSCAGAKADKMTDYRRIRL